MPPEKYQRRPCVHIPWNRSGIRGIEQDPNQHPVNNARAVSDGGLRAGGSDGCIAARPGAGLHTGRSGTVHLLRSASQPGHKNDGLPA